MKNVPSKPITAADLRSRIAEANVRKYIVAARACVNPQKLSALLNERAPLDQRIAARILRACGDGQ